MAGFCLANVPGEFAWRIEPLQWKCGKGDLLEIVAGPESDLFTDPGGAAAKDNAPCALFTPPDPEFRFSARVEAEFGSTYDAGALHIRTESGPWGKLALEYSPDWKPTIVSVVTRGLSDDCNSAPVKGNCAYLRISRNGAAFAFHYSLDGKKWQMVRYFSLGETSHPQIGLSAQSPLGATCRASFSEIAYLPGSLADIRNGD
jgi:uncharacterized protein